MAFERIVEAKWPHAILQVEHKVPQGALQRGRQYLADATGDTSINKLRSLRTWVKTKFYSIRDCSFCKKYLQI